MLRIASWNINSVRLRLELLTKIIEQYNFDVIALQETKTPDEYFPLQELQKLGYPYIVFRGQKSYNGVAIISKLPFKKDFFIDMNNKGDTRHIAVEFLNGLTLHNFYIPAGGDVPDSNLNPKFAHKLGFLDEMTDYFNVSLPKKTIILGDFNIAPLEHDVWSHKQLANVVSHTEIEITKLQKLKLAANWLDTHRYFVDNKEKLYSWWSYRARDWQKSNRGRRLDHIWVSNDLQNDLQEANIYKETRSCVRPSDHAVIDIVLKLV